MNNWIINTLGLTLLHSLWQIGLVSFLLFAVLRLLQNAGASLRYTLSISALVLSIALPISTFVYLSSSKSEISAPNSAPEITKESSQESSPQILPVSARLNENAAANEIKNENSTSFAMPPLMPTLVLLWLIGVLLFSIRLAGGFWVIRRYKTQQTSPVSQDWQETFNELCKNLQISRSIRFLRSNIVEIPVVIGWLKPFVLVPTSAFLQIAPQQLETILIHELIHIKRHDYLVNFAQSMIEILFFYHPGVWWISAKIRTEREFAVDEFVADIFDRERAVYANALANLEEIRITSQQQISSLAMAGSGGNLRQRIERILKTHRNISVASVSVWSAVFAITLTIGLATGTFWISSKYAKVNKSGKKVAIAFNAMSNETGNGIQAQQMLNLQNKYEIPLTWILDSKILNELQKAEVAEKFYGQTVQNRNEFMVNVPNIDATIFMNGLDEYVDNWKKRIEETDKNLTKFDGKLKYYTTYSKQIPQPMEDYLANRGLILRNLPSVNLTFMFHYAYSKTCTIAEKGPLCVESSSERKQEIRGKYLEFMQRLIDLNGNYSREKYGQETPQLVLLENDSLTKDSADELLTMLKNKGYEFVPVDEVISDETFIAMNDMTKNREFQKMKFELEKELRPKDVYSKFEIPEKYKDRYKTPANFIVTVDAKINNANTKKTTP